MQRAALSLAGMSTSSAKLLIAACTVLERFFADRRKRGVQRILHDCVNWPDGRFGAEPLATAEWLATRGVFQPVSNPWISKPLIYKSAGYFWE